MAHSAGMMSEMNEFVIVIVQVIAPPKNIGKQTPTKTVETYFSIFLEVILDMDQFTPVTHIFFFCRWALKCQDGANIFSSQNLAQLEN